MKDRILSIDILRGLTICFMIIVNTPGSWSHVYAPLLHAKWHGWTPTDLVFPSFLFVVGLSMFYSFNKASFLTKSEYYIKITKRAFLIILIGILLNWFPLSTSLESLRVFGVLQRIGLAFFGAALLVVLFNKSKQLLIMSALGLMFIHWIILYTGSDSGPFTLENNIGRYIDIQLVGANHVYEGFGIPFDPEGLLGTLSSISQVLIGYLIAMSFYNSNNDKNTYLKQLIGAAVLFIVISYLLNIVYPINKPLWTGSYVLLSCGVIMLIWSLFIWIIDIREKQDWTYFFKVLGRNPLISYALSILIAKSLYSVIKFSNTDAYSWLYENVYQHLLSPKFGSLLFALSITGLVWIFAYYLDKKNIIIKV